MPDAVLSLALFLLLFFLSLSLSVKYICLSRSAGDGSGWARRWAGAARAAMELSAEPDAMQALSGSAATQYTLLLCPFSTCPAEARLPPQLLHTHCNNAANPPQQSGQAAGRSGTPPLAPTWRPFSNLLLPVAAEAPVGSGCPPLLSPCSHLSPQTVGGPLEGGGRGRGGRTRLFARP